MRSLRFKIALNAVILGAILFIASAHSYPFGWYWNLPGHFCGIEISPTFGVFCDVT